VWWLKLQRSVWPSAVVVGAVLGEDGLKVPLAEDQDAVGELGSGGQDEAFGEAVRSRTARRDLHGVDPGAGQDGVERCGELAGAVADEEPEGVGAVVEVHEQIAGLLSGPRSGRVAGRAEDVQVAGADLEGEEEIRFRVMAQSTWKKSTASMVVACARRNRLQDVSVARSGAGSIRRSLGIRRIVDAPTRCPSLSSSPWMRR
jgi:hypothetical protein